MCTFRRPKSTSTLPVLSAMLLITLAASAGCVRAQDAPEMLTLIRAPYIQSTTARSVQIVWETSLQSRAFMQYKIGDVYNIIDWFNANTF